MRLVFLGTGSLGLPTLRALAHSHQILAVFTQPDRPAGRGLKLKTPPVKIVAQELKLPVHQPAKIQREVEAIRALSPDALVIVAYGQILSKELLDVPRLGCVNLHASLLPKYRGAAPIQWALMEGETKTGVTTLLLDEGLDTGPILLQRECPISEEDTAGTLGERLAQLGADLVRETLEGLEMGRLTPRPQDPSQASYAPKIPKELERLNWTKGARTLFNLIRALSPAPGAYTLYQGRRLKIYRSRALASSIGEPEPGTVIDFGPQGPIVQTGQGALELLEVQPEGRRPMSGLDFARGYRLKMGDALGH